jgi:hypothetical protein
MKRRSFLGALGALASLPLLRKVPKGEKSFPVETTSWDPSVNEHLLNELRKDQEMAECQYELMKQWQEELARVMREEKDKEIAKLFRG